MLYRFLVILLAILVSSCSRPGEKRERKAERGKGDVVIGVVVPAGSEEFLDEGIQLAVDELNEAGGVLGRKIKIVLRDDQDSPEKGKKIAREFARNPNIVAVIGHSDSHVATLASITYEYNKMVFISPLATSPELLSHGFKYIFRNAPSHEEFVCQLVGYAKEKRLKKIIVLYTNDEYGEGFAQSFTDQAVDHGLEIAGSFSVNTWEHNLKGTLVKYESELSGMYDAIFISAKLPIGAEMIKVIRELRYNGPFLGGLTLNSVKLWEIAGRAAEGTVVVSMASPNDPRMKEFVRVFHKKYGVQPHSRAALAYDAVKVLAYAMESAGSTVPRNVAQALHLVRDWQGVTGVHTFDETGDVVQKPIVLKALRNGTFELLDDEERTLPHTKAPE